MDFLPMPHHVRRLEGRFCIRYNGCIMLQDTEPSALLYARMLRDTIRECSCTVRKQATENKR